MKRVFQIVPLGSSNSTNASIFPVKNMRFSKFASALMVVFLVMPSLAISLGAETLTVKTDEVEYGPGDGVEIFGTAEANLNVSITVEHDLTLLFDFNITAEDDGNYSDDVTLPVDKFGTFTVNATQGGASAQTTFTVIDTAQENLAQELLEQAEELWEEVEEIFDEFEEHGIEIPPEAEGNMTLGVDAMTLALEYLGDGNYSDAVDEAYEALQYFGKAFQLVQETADQLEDADVEDEEPEEDDVERAFGLYMAIDRAFQYIDKVNETVDRLLDEGYDFDNVTIRERLKEINDTLSDLRDALESLDPNKAAQQFAEIRENLGQTMGLLRSTAIKQHKMMQTERFMEQVQKRIEGLDEKIERLQERIEEKKTERAKDALGSVLRKIEQLRERLVDEEVDDIVDELEDAVDEIDDELDELNGEGTSKNLKAMNKVEARIRVLNATVERLMRRGLNTTIVEEELEAAEELLEDMMEHLIEGATDAAEELREEIEEFIEDIREGIKDSKRSWIEEKKKEKQEKATEEDGTEEVESEESGAAEETEELLEELEELAEEIGILEGKTEELSASEMNVTDAEAKLQEARDLLEEAREQAADEPEAAEDLMEEAEEAIDQAKDLIEELEETSEGAGTRQGSESGEEEPEGAGENRGLNQTTG